MLIWSVDCRGWDLAEQVISSVLHFTGVNPYALVVKQKIILMFNVMTYNVTIISVHSDLHGLNYKYKKEYWICMVEGQLLTPELLCSGYGLQY